MPGDRREPRRSLRGAAGSRREATCRRRAPQMQRGSLRRPRPPARAARSSPTRTGGASGTAAERVRPRVAVTRSPGVTLLGLAGRAPVGGAVLVALPARFDRRAASAAASAGSVVDDTAVPTCLDGGGHKIVRGLEHRPKLPVGDLLEPAPGRHARFPERLRPPDVPDPCDETLIEQSIPDRPAGLAAQVRNHGLEIRRLSEDVWPQAPNGPVGEFEDRPVPEDGLPSGTAEHEPRATEEPGAPCLHAPAPGHPQVTAENNSVFEAQ